MKVFFEYNGILQSISLFFNDEKKMPQYSVISLVSEENLKSAAFPAELHVFPTKHYFFYSCFLS